MRDFWAFLGKMCLDPDFHKRAHDASLDESDPTKIHFKRLATLSEFLRNEKLILSRLSVLEANLCLRFRYRGMDDQPATYISDVMNDAEMKKVQDEYDGRGLDFEGYRDVLSVVGLCCVDSKFRERLVRDTRLDHADTAELKDLLVDGTKEPDTPLFSFSSGDLRVLNGIFKASAGSKVESALAEVEKKVWFQLALEKYFGSCFSGYTSEDVDLQFLPQREIALYVNRQHHAEADSLMFLFPPLGSQPQ